MRALERLHDLGHRDRLRGPSELIAAVGTARGGDQLGLAQARHQLLQIGEGQLLRVGDLGQRHRPGTVRRPSWIITRTPYSDLVENII